MKLRKNGYERLLPSSPVIPRRHSFAYSTLPRIKTFSGIFSMKTPTCTGNITSTSSAGILSTSSMSTSSSLSKSSTSMSGFCKVIVKFFVIVYICIDVRVDCFFSAPAVVVTRRVTSACPPTTTNRRSTLPR